MPSIKCPITGCTYEASGESSAIALELLKLHRVEHENQQHQSVPRQVSTVNAPKLNRPSVDTGIDQESWLTFTRRWETFKLGSGIDDGIASIQLFQCATEQVAHN